MNRALFSSATDEWETPQTLFDELDAEFHFDLDPCANDENHKCRTYYTAEQDGLAKNWGGAGYGAILHTGGRSGAGWRKHTARAARTGRLWCC